MYGISKMLHANTSIDYVYKNRANIIIYDLTRTRDVTKQSAKLRQYPFIKMRIIDR